MTRNIFNVFGKTMVEVGNHDEVVDIMILKKT
jgi:hypothetical protein